MIRRVIISRTDAIGDVVLTLPLALLLKQRFPGVHVAFLGRSYTSAVIAACSAIDSFINRDEFIGLAEHQQLEMLSGFDAIIHVFPDKAIAGIAKRSGIRLRIGTSHRFHHWFTCNRLVPVGRKRSPLHEAQLNACLLKPLGFTDVPDLGQLRSLTLLDRPAVLEEQYSGLIDSARRAVILHPTSKGSAREWGLDNFNDLISQLSSASYQIFISGSGDDEPILQPLLSRWGNRVTSLVGKLSLEQFIAFISRSDALVAASTGPLHIAAALGRAAVGLYAPMRPIHPGRWEPIGVKAKALVIDKVCQSCRQGGSCACIQAISPSLVIESLEQLIGQEKA